MTRRRAIAWSLVAWVGVGLFWYCATRGFHPTRGLALVVTTSLVAAYAAAAYVNHLVLIPRYWRAGEYARYAASLAGTAALFTALGFAVLRTCYLAALGPDPDPNGVYRHYFIDLFGMAVHLVLAAGVVRLVGLVVPAARESTSPSRAGGGESARILEGRPGG